jgi:tetratricopeptide (TPR) repeat protein
MRTSRRHWAHGVLAIAWLLGACAASIVEPKAPVGPPPADPRAARVYLDGVKLIAANDAASEQRAIAAFEEALRIDPKLWEAHYNLGVLYRRRGEIRKALPHLQAAHALDPAAGEPLIALAEAQHALGDHDTAAKLLNEYLQGHAESNQVRIALTALLREQGEYDQALSSAREALVRDPANVQALLEVGRVYKAKGDLDVAELVFQKVLALDAKSATAHNDLGLLALARGDTQRAFDEFEKATGSDESFTPARMNRASVLLRAGDYASARSEYAKVLTVAPRTVEARVALGICLRGLGKHQEAEKEYQQALSDAPNHPAALFNLALLRADFLNRRSEARELFERYLEVSASDDAGRVVAERYLSEIAASAAAKASEADGSKQSGSAP